MENRLFAFLSSKPKEQERRPPSGQEVAEQAAEHASRWVDNTEHWIARNPKLALGLGMAMGVVIGWFVKRRR